MIDFNQIKPGDIVLYKKNEKYKISLVSKLIRLIQGNDNVHVAMVIWAYNRCEPIVAEIDSSFNARIVPLTKSMERGTPEIYRLKTDEEYCAWRVYEEAKLSEGLPYGYAKIANALINHLFGRIIPGYTYSNWIKSDKEICSTYVSKLLALGFKTKYNNVSEPDDYCKEPFYRIL